MGCIRQLISWDVYVNARSMEQLLSLHELFVLRSRLITARESQAVVGKYRNINVIKHTTTWPVILKKRQFKSFDTFTSGCHSVNTSLLYLIIN